MRQGDVGCRPVRLVIVGSIALDTIQTPDSKRSDILGGSVSYACAAASRLAHCGMVGVVGNDFPARHPMLFRRLGVDLRGLQKVPGRTFRWSGVYECDMNRRRTLSTELNVFADFVPELPEVYRSSPFLFLANIAPELQLHVLTQMRAPRFVAADTMDLWIKTARKSLLRLLKHVNLLLVNDSEARELTGESHLISAARALLRFGPRYVIIKKGEHGSFLVSSSGVLALTAYPVDEVHDPTGAGDAFAGGFMGQLARRGVLTSAALKRAMLYGTVTASFAVEAFGLDRLAGLRSPELEERVRRFVRMIRV